MGADRNFYCDFESSLLGGNRAWYKNSIEFKMSGILLFS